MPAGIVPESVLGLHAAFATCFGAPSYRTFELLVVGWVAWLATLYLAVNSVRPVIDLFG